MKPVIFLKQIHATMAFRIAKTIDQRERVRMHRSQGHRLEASLSAARFLARETFSAKADFCADVLLEAHRLARLERAASQLNQYVARACDLLDDMDEVLVTLDPVHDSSDFATAAALHRQLECIQAAMSARRRVTGALAQSDIEA